MAEADGNRTRQRQDLPLSDFEDRADHQTGYASLAHGDIMAGSMEAMAYRLTQYAHGGGCACKIPPGELEDMVRGLTKAAPRDPVGELLVGLEAGDDAAAVRIDGGHGADRDDRLLHPGGRRLRTTGAGSRRRTHSQMCTPWAGGRWSR